ncbi:hypothetical protein OG417_05700 [Actinoallomurus sp. NBC_01490]|uniref:hypothetical protein n=1 Tax=Actinoallomurus sp. NBC_01490 TaxID=2903557 RepID=UPI002E2F1A40|nr:hypothetical protein [Actinoallomurus sp. NBC_01490]
MASRIIAALRTVLATVANVLLLPFRVLARLLGVPSNGRSRAARRTRRQAA